MDTQCLVIISAIFSTISLAVTLLVKEMNLQEKSVKHKDTADDLWIIREKYISLLTDFPILSEDDIQKNGMLLRKLQLKSIREHFQQTHGVTVPPKTHLKIMKNSFSLPRN